MVSSRFRRRRARGVVVGCEGSGLLVSGPVSVRRIGGGRRGPEGFGCGVMLVSENEKKDGIQLYTWTGKKMNNKYHLKGNNAYPDNLNFIAIPLSDLNGKAPIVKNQVGARWLNDIVDNNRFRNR